MNIYLHIFLSVLLVTTFVRLNLLLAYHKHHQRDSRQMGIYAFGIDVVIE